MKKPQDIVSDFKKWFHSDDSDLGSWFSVGHNNSTWANTGQETQDKEFLIIQRL